MATPTNLRGTTIPGTQTPPAAVRLEAVVKRFGDDDVGRRVARFVATDGAIGLELGLATIIVGHATFCIVVIYNNVIARLRRTSRSIEEASADLGADIFATFRRVTFPAVRTALIAGALLAFALSFDEIIVTNFTSGPGTQTLPLWIFSNFQRPNQLPLVNVAAVLVLLLSIVPVYLASRLTADPAAIAGART